MVKNITFVSQYFAPAWAYGGPPKVFYLLAKELIKKEKNVRVITSDALNNKRNDLLFEKMDGIEVYRFKTISNLLAYKLKIFAVPNILDKVKKILDHSDIVLFSDLRVILNWQLYGYLLKKDIPYGIFPFGEIPYGSGLKAAIKKIFDGWWTRNFVKKASFRFAQTEHEREMFRQFFNIPLARTQLLPLPVEEKQHVTDVNLLKSFRSRWNIDEDDKVLLFLGRLHYLKGVDILIRAVEPLLKNDKRLKLLIVGRNDGEENNLRLLVSADLNKQIIFTGPLYEKDAFCAYNISSCFVFTPRHYEETSLAALEALSLGIPVLTIYEADIPFLEKYRAGLVVKNDVFTIRQSIIEMLNKITKDKKAIHVQTKKLIKDYFLAEKIAKKLLNYLDAKFNKIKRPHELIEL